MHLKHEQPNFYGHGHNSSLYRYNLQNNAYFCKKKFHYRTLNRAIPTILADLLESELLNGNNTDPTRLSYMSIMLNLRVETMTLRQSALNISAICLRSSTNKQLQQLLAISVSTSKNMWNGLKLVYCSPFTDPYRFLWGE